MSHVTALTTQFRTHSLSFLLYPCKYPPVLFSLTFYWIHLNGGWMNSSTNFHCTSLKQLNITLLNWNACRWGGNTSVIQFQPLLFFYILPAWHLLALKIFTIPMLEIYLSFFASKKWLISYLSILNLITPIYMSGSFGRKETKILP